MPAPSRVSKQNRFVADGFSFDLEKFWSKVDKSGGPQACWSWLATKDRLGYGRFHVHVAGSHNAVRLAHRLAFLISTNSSPEAVCHKCDNPNCCNPKHMFGGTRADNNKDMHSKGRHSHCMGRSGFESLNSKLTKADVCSIREIYTSGSATQYDLASRFGVCQRTISKVVRFLGYTNG